MIAARPILHVWFKTLVPIAGVPVDHFSVQSPGSTMVLGKIDVRHSDPERADEHPGGVVLEHRISPADRYDVIVGAENIANITVKCELETIAKPPAKK